MGGAVLSLLEGAAAVFAAGFMPDDIMDLNNIMYCAEKNVFTWIDIGSAAYDDAFKHYLAMRLAVFVYAAADQDQDRRTANLSRFRVDPLTYEPDDGVGDALLQALCEVQPRIPSRVVQAIGALVSEGAGL